MAKTKAAKETSLPVIIALVFFVLTTIGLGVFCYVLYSDQEAKDQAVAKATADLKNARQGETEAKQIALIHRLFAGLAEGDDLKDLGEIKEGDKAFQELKRLNTLYKDKAPAMLKAAADRVAKDSKLDVATIALDEAPLWTTELDDRKLLKPPSPNTSLIDLAVRSQMLRHLALKQATDDRNAYLSTLKTLDETAKAYEAAKKDFTTKSVELPKTFKLHMDKLSAEAEARKQEYQKDVADARKSVDKLTTQLEGLNAEKRKMADDATRIKSDLNTALLKNQKDVDPLQFDQPQGRITNRLANNIVEIDLGTNARVLPGLTFTVLPSDFPEKGRQSRMKVFRAPDQRGRYQSVEQFVPKATIEVMEVLGPTLSRARITAEYDDIRERAMTGDLLYNSVWRKGHADHIALVGIFDTNGDGTDDIAAVVRDLTKMGIPVDAYYNLQTKKWVGQINERTRYLVDGYTPLGNANDPNREARTALLGAINTAREEAKAKGITVVNFRDFFGKIGYRVQQDVPEERINQAAARYLGGLGVVDTPPPSSSN